MTSREDNSAFKPRILVVDDSKVMRRAVTKILGDRYDVIEADHGEDGWTFLTNDPSIQVVFTDLSMPYLDGFGLLDRIRSSTETPLQDIPVIIITGKEDDDDTKQQALARGATDFITKPFDSVQLKARAQAHVKFEQTARKLSQTTATLEQEAAVDPVTGLGSKRYFSKSAGETLAYAKRHGQRLLLVRLDIDDFNALFIRNGREAANAVLAAIGQRLVQSVREEDKAARLGLASFVLLLQSTGLDGALSLADRIRAEIAAQTFEHGGKPIRATVSIGVAQPAIGPDSTLDDLLGATEQQLALAIRAGGNRVSAEASRTAASGLAETPDLSEALARLAGGETQMLAPHAAVLLERVLPLIEYCASELGPTASQHAASLRRALEAAR